MREFSRILLTGVLLAAVALLLFVVFRPTPQPRQPLSCSACDAPERDGGEPSGDDADACAGEYPEDSPAGNRPRGTGCGPGLEPESATTHGEGWRKPGDKEWKPDLEAIEKARREEAARIAALWGAFGLVQAGEVEGESGANTEGEEEDLNAQTVWSFPSAAMLTQRDDWQGFTGEARNHHIAATPADFTAHYAGPLRDLRWTAEELQAQGFEPIDVDASPTTLGIKEGENLLIVGRVKRPATASQSARPVLRCADQWVYCNAAGYFCLLFNAAPTAGTRSKPDNAFSVMSWLPGCLPAAADLAPDQDSRAAFTLTLQQGPHLVVDVTVRPSHAMQSELVAWVEDASLGEVRGNSDSTPMRLRVGPSLFLSARVPRSGRLRFFLPHPDTWPGDEVVSGLRAIRLGVAGDGWAVPEVQVLDIPHHPRNEADLFGATNREPIEQRHLKVELNLERAYCERVTGKVRQPNGESLPGGRPVRLESMQTGAVGYSGADGTFDFWVPYAKGNWKQYISVDDHDANLQRFAIDYDVNQPHWATLAASGRAPGGPWNVNLLPSSDRAKKVIRFDPLCSTKLNEVLVQFPDNQFAMLPIGRRQGVEDPDGPGFSVYSLLSDISLSDAKLFVEGRHCKLDQAFYPFPRGEKPSSEHPVYWLLTPR